MFLLFILLGMIIGAIITAPIVFKSIMKSHGAKMLADRQKYETRWKEALEIIESGEQITDEQLERIKSPTQLSVTSGASTLPRGVGSSYNRAQIEIMRAKKKLPPGDNLEGMSGYHRREVMMARIKHGTSQ